MELCTHEKAVEGGSDEYKAQERTCGEIKPTLMDTTDAMLAYL